MPLAAPLPPSYPPSPVQQRPRHSPLLTRPPSSHTPTPYYPTPPLHPHPPLSSSPSSPPKSLAGLEALVQAATQERRRLSAGADPEHPPPTPLQDESHHRRSQPIDIKRSPQYQRHHRSQERLVDDPYPRPSLNPSTSTADDFSLRAASFPQSHLPRPRPEEPRLSPVALRTPYDDERYLHQPDQRRHHEHLLRQEQKLHQQQQRLEHQQRLEQQAREQHLREVQAREQQLREQQAQRDHEIMRAQEAKRAQEAERQRAEAVRMAEEAKRAEERRRMELQLERERLQEQEERRLHEQRIREQRELQRLQEQRIHEQRLQEQRFQEQREQQREQQRLQEQRLQEQREQQRLQEQHEQQRLQDQHEQQRLQEQREQQRLQEQRAHEQRLQEQREQQRLQEQRIREQHEHQRLVEQQQSEPTVEPPRPRTQPESPPIMHHDDRPSKKPRYSQSPSRPEDKEKVINGELGYGPPHHPPSSSAGPRRPGSGTGRRTMAVSDLVSVTDKERSIANANLQSDRPSHRVLSPLGRRSPPGSLTGRAIAARKTTDEVVEKKEPVTVSIPPAPQYTAPTQIVIPESEPPKVKEEPVAVKAPPREVRPPPPPAPPPVIAELPKKTKPKDHRTKEQQKEDAHDWLLEHYAREPSPEPSPRPEPPCSPSPSISPVVVASPSRPTVTTEVQSPSPEPTKRIPTPIREATPPKVDAAIEELEELVAETEAEIKPKPSSVVNKQEPLDVDMDLDELVAEALEDVPITSKREEEEEEEEEVPMEVDVEDELLSLVGDRPLPLSARRAVSGSSTSVPPSHPTKPIPLRMSTDAERQPSPPPATSLSAPTPSTLLSPIVHRSSSARPASERGSMPPPTTTPTAGSFPRAKEKEKEETAKKGEQASSSAPLAKKKKEVVATKPPAKPKVTTGDKTTKARSKPPPKPKKGTETSSPVALPMKASKSGSGPGGKKTSASRSRSASVMPAGSVGPEGDPQADKQEEEDSDGANDDDKLYCVCKTKYDEDRFMIACDRCDEWYHTQCVNLPELEVDLIDQFICPPCIEKNPEMSLKTTYKKRCLYGLKHPDPSSRKACHKPARGAFSKYCSEECGVKCMQLRIESYAKKGGKKDKLWESVKNAERREGVVVCVDNVNGHIKMDVDESKEDGDVKPLSNKRSKVARETDRLKGSLEQIVKLREEIKKGMEVVIWRQKLLELASERAEQLELCGWDHRLCFSDDELADYGASVLESYEENGVKEENGDMQVDGAGEHHGDWWCPGNASCGRHLGWQLTRYKDVCKEKEKKEEALMKLTTREREIRKHIEDIVDPQGRNTNEAPPQSPLKPVNTKLSNGHARSKLGGDGVKKGKKRKAPAS